MKIMKTIILSLLLAYTFSAKAVMRLPKIIGSNMVLQQRQAVPIWGWDAPGMKITVNFAGQDKQAVADANGYWNIALSPLTASFDGRSMTIKGSETVTLSNILVGEVWLGGGQSNMEYSMKGFGKPALKGTDSTAVHVLQEFPAIRIIKVERIVTGEDITTTGWNEAKGTALEKISAPGFYFARELNRRLKVPVGFILSAWSGSRIEPWTPYESYAAMPAFAADVAKNDGKIGGVVPGNYYRHMIAPLGNFAIKGFLWYQGESNVTDTNMLYASKMLALINTWRSQWKNEKLPFYFVEIAPYNYTRPNTPNGKPENLAAFWEQQKESLQIPYTGMVVVSDLVDNLGDIHPSYKWEVGRRLSLLALNHDYGMKNIETSGPVYKKMTVKGNKAILEFDHASALKSIDDKPLSWFTLAGADGKFVPATATIVGKKIELTAPGVDAPANARFAWLETAQPNLANMEGLPAVPFRTNGKTWDYPK